MASSGSSNKASSRSTDSGKARPYEIFIDAKHVKAKTVVVKLKAHWKNLSVCDMTATNTIELLLAERPKAP